MITVDGIDSIGVRTKGMLALAFDHRIVDGADADRFMADVKKSCRSSPRRGSEVSRTLTVSRVSVRPGKDEEYLAAVRELAGLAEGRGWHLWVFRRPDESGTYLECSESRQPGDAPCDRGPPR